MKFNDGYLECSEDRAKEKGKKMSVCNNPLCSFLIFLTSNTMSLLIYSASQALREGAAKLRKEGYGDIKKDAGPLVVQSILLPSERTSKTRSGCADDEKHCDKFDPPRPKKKTKRASV